MSATRAARVAQGLSAGIGLALLAMGVRAALAALREPLGFYDEGLLLSDALFLRRGLVPHRDFYANYPPGASGIVALLWTATGVGAWPVRCLGLAVRLLAVVLAARLAGRLLGGGWSLLAAGLLAAWSAPIMPLPFAWPVALVSAFACVEFLLAALARPTPAWALLAGLSFGLVGATRHDLFAFLGAGLVLLAVGARLSGTPALRPWALALFAGATALPLAVAYGPVVLAGAAPRALHDLVLDQARYVLPQRHRGLPPFFTPLPVEAWGVTLPSALTNTHDGGAALVLLAVPAALALALVRRRAGRPVAPALLVGLLAACAAIQMLGRPDRAHVLYSIAPALTLFAALVEGFAREARTSARLAALALCALLVVPFAAGGGRTPNEGEGEEGRDLNLERAAGTLQPSAYVASVRRQLLKWLRTRTAADERVFFGEDSHRQAEANEMDLYFLSDRLPAARYAQFDPGLVTSDAIQAQMIGDLEARRTRVVVLSSRTPSPPGPLGSARLDEYLAARYEEVARFGPYVVAQRRPGL